MERFCSRFLGGDAYFTAMNVYAQPPVFFFTVHRQHQEFNHQVARLPKTCGTLLPKITGTLTPEY